MSVFFPPGILGPEMAAPILWAPGVFGSFCRKTLHDHKIPRFGGVFRVLEGGGGSAILFLWVRGFLTNILWNWFCHYIIVAAKRFGWNKIAFLYLERNSQVAPLFHQMTNSEKKWILRYISVTYNFSQNLRRDHFRSHGKCVKQVSLLASLRFVFHSRWGEEVHTQWFKLHIAPLQK